MENIIKQIRSTFDESLRKKQLKLCVSNNLNGHKLVVDKLSFTQNVINNIISNAIKFSFPENTIHIESCVQDDTYVRIEIRDKGVGIPNKLKNIIWDDTRKTHRDGTWGETGTGFGMPLAKKFMEAQGGRIEVESVSREEDPHNHGTRFILYVPYN